MCLSQHFVPKYLGVNHLSRNQAWKHNTSFTLEFFGDNVTVIWDGTFIYTGKSSANSTNRATYSGQKHRHFLKFMSLVLPDDYELNTICPFRGNMNDPSIAQHVLRICDSLIGWCEDDDVMLVDRGFRDVIYAFRKIGYEPKMPAFLWKGQTQHTTEEANESRLCTKNRRVVESYRARIKKWRLWTETVQNSCIPSLNDCVRIISAALNHFRDPIIFNATNDTRDKIARVTKNRITQRNIIFEKVQNGELSARSR